MVASHIVACCSHFTSSMVTVEEGWDAGLELLNDAAVFQSSLSAFTLSSWIIFRREQCFSVTQRLSSWIALSREQSSCWLRTSSYEPVIASSFPVVRIPMFIRSLESEIWILAPRSNESFKICNFFAMLRYSSQRPPKQMQTSSSCCCMLSRYSE